jgi:ABC-type transporter Mla maintaining outer membrane lipid asymmetry ATPase subunit MlaF
MDSLNRVQPVDIIVRNLGLKIRQQSMSERLGIKSSSVQSYKEIFRNVSLHIPAGQLTAVMGGSGSGKVYACISETQLIQ